MHLSYATEKSYAGWAQSYIRALPKYPTAWPSEKKAEAFLTGLAQRDVAAATQNQALNAIAFLYKDVLGTPLGTVDALRVRRPATVREALSVDEVRALLSAMPEVADATACLVVRLLYGCGLRAEGERAAGIAHQGCGSGWCAADDPGKQGSGVKN